MTGDAPPASNNAWNVHYEAAFARWLTSNPPIAWVTAVAEWVKACQMMGPPPDAVDLGGEFYVAQVDRTRVSMVDYE